MSIETIPHHHSGVKDFVTGQTACGFPFKLEVSTQKNALNTLGRARMMMHFQEQIMKEKSLTAYEGYRRSADVKWQSVEESADISLKIFPTNGGKPAKFYVKVNLDGTYSTGDEKFGSLRELVRDVSRTVEYNRGVGIAPAAMRM